MNNTNRPMTDFAAFSRLEEIYQFLKDSGHPDAEAYAIVLGKMSALSRLETLALKLSPIITEICISVDKKV